MLQLGYVLLQLQRRRALARDDRGLVVGMDGDVARRDQFFETGPARFVGRIAEVHDATEAAHRLDLECGGVARHDLVRPGSDRYHRISSMSMLTADQHSAVHFTGRFTAPGAALERMREVNRWSIICLFYGS